jgi:hypothetical protein
MAEEATVDTKTGSAAATDAAATTAATTDVGGKQDAGAAKDAGKTAAADTTAGKTATAATDTGKQAADGTEDAAAAAKGAWPDDWVTRMSKGDQKRAKDLGRYASPEALADGYVNLRKRVDSGELKPTLPKNAKPDDIKAWRKDNGIPEKPDGYDLAGITVPTRDKDMIGGVLTRLHKANATPEVAREAVSAIYDQIAQRETLRAERDEQQRTEVLDTLNEEWGPQFRRNLNLIEGTILSRFPEDVRDLLKSARLPDGTAIFNNASAIRALVSLANEINPAGIVVPGGTGDIGKTMVEEWKAIQKIRTETRSVYNKDDAMQKRERELIEAMIKHGLMNEAGQLVERKAA